MKNIFMIFDVLRDLVSFVQFKTCEKHTWRSFTFSKVARSKLTKRYYANPRDYNKEMLLHQVSKYTKLIIEAKDKHLAKLTFEVLDVKLESTQRPAKQPTNHQQTSQTSHKPATNQPNDPQTNQTTYKLAKPPTNHPQNQPNYPQTSHKTSQTTHKVAIKIQL